MTESPGTNRIWTMGTELEELLKLMLYDTKFKHNVLMVPL